MSSGASAPGSPSTAQVPAVGLDGSRTGAHSRAKSESRSPESVRSCSGVTGVSTTDSAAATGSPVSSAMRTVTPCCAGRISTRSAFAPTADSVTPDHEDGRPPATGWKAAASRAGCSPNPWVSVSSSSAISANSSSPRRHTARSVRKAGP